MFHTNYSKSVIHTFKYDFGGSDCCLSMEGIETKRLLILAVLAIALVGMAGAANYMYEKASVKGVGYKIRRDDCVHSDGL